MKAHRFHTRLILCGALGVLSTGACLVLGAATQTGTPAKRPVPPATIYSAPTFAGQKFPDPILDDVFKPNSISLETNGTHPREAFDLLGNAVGVTFKPGQDHSPPPGVHRTIWEAKTYRPLNFDIKNLNFWQAATKIGDAAGLFPLGGHRVMTLEALPPSGAFTTTYPKQIMDMRSLRATLFGQMTSGPRLDLSFSINIQVDPRVKLLTVGKVVWRGTGEGEGMPENIQMYDQKYPGSDTLRKWYTGIQSITQSLVLRNLQDMNADVTFESLHGYVPATAALATKPLEFVFEGDEMKDQTPHEIGDWRITASAVEPLKNLGRNGGVPPDHAMTITIERLRDGALPFPENPQAICSVEGNGSVSVTSRGDKTEVLTFNYYSSTNSTREPVKRVIIDVPTEAQEVVLPFEFKHVVFSALP